MSIDLLLTEKEIDKNVIEYDELGLSRKIKHFGIPNKSSFKNFNNDWLQKILGLPDFALGLYLEIKNVVDYALENSYTHGGDRLSIRLKYSDSSEFALIKDNGPGFNVKEVVRKFLLQKKYFILGGHGFQGMSESNAKIGFNKEGNKTLIFYEMENPAFFYIEKAHDYRKMNGIFRKTSLVKK